MHEFKEKWTVVCGHSLYVFRFNEEKKNLRCWSSKCSKIVKLLNAPQQNPSNAKSETERKSEKNNKRKKTYSIILVNIIYLLGTSRICDSFDVGYEWRREKKEHDI